MRAFFVILLLSVSSCSCGPPTSRLTSGRYVAGGTTLQLDVTAKTASLTPSGGSAMSLTLTAVAEASWPSGCPTNYSSTILEALTISPDPVVINGTSVSSPRLTAGCGINGANADQVAIESSSGSPKIVFTRE